MSLPIRRSRALHRRAAIGLLTVALTAAGLAVAAPSASGAPARRPVHVWRVGRYHGIRGNVGSIAAAIRRARPGDWILIGPGDYHPRMDYTAAQRHSDAPAALLITRNRIHLRGMSRARVVIDGTRRGAPRCSARRHDQTFGRLRKNTAPGRNGIEVLDANGVTIDNLTACNFLSGSTDSGNEIWWNGGDDSGTINLGSWYGEYLSATSTYYDRLDPETSAQYGIFVSNSRGPGEVEHAYASNFSDSGYYIGACPDCRATLDHVHAVNNALGYSGTNSGGRLVVENSEFDHNKDGFDTNSQNSADPPSPQDGRCPTGVTGPTGTDSCWVFRHNFVHDNNNPNVPESGDAALGPVGSGMTLAGSRYDTVIHNRFVRNGSWAVLTTVFPDLGAANPHNNPNCRGGVVGGSFLGLTVPCLYDVFGNEIAHNTFRGNGFFGNPTNGDLADLATAPSESPGAAGDCFHGNHKASGAAATTWPATLQTTQGTCGQPVYPDPASTAVLGQQVLCATQALGPCPTGVPDNYPRQTKVAMAPLPRRPSMPDPCEGVPGRNPWCP